ncbi:MAG: hypothetical protein M3003_01845 [Candidatus Dormibacteraeota bacterium]|nr:hypothetical protein [Candidatus Dormibacteraeota bacterium]
MQQGVIAQNEFAKLVMIGTGGKIELAAPLTDEERRDFEIHVHGQYKSALATQVKSALEIGPIGGSQAHYLRIHFDVRASRLVSDPHFWYFCAFLNPTIMRFSDPTFLIPSEEFHRHANPSRKGDVWHFTLEASMEAKSHDRWTPYRVNQRDLGKKVMAITRELIKVGSSSHAAPGLLEIPGMIWARKV